jgi:hypothetical protein
MSDFGVSHVIVAGQTDGRPMRLERGHQRLGQQAIENRSIGYPDTVAAVSGSQSDPIHNDGNHRAW